MNCDHTTVLQPGQQSKTLFQNINIFKKGYSPDPSGQLIFVHLKDTLLPPPFPPGLQGKSRSRKGRMRYTPRHLVHECSPLLVPGELRMCLQGPLCASSSQKPSLNAPLHPRQRSSPPCCPVTAFDPVRLGACSSSSPA